MKRIWIIVIVSVVTIALVITGLMLAYPTSELSLPGSFFGTVSPTPSATPTAKISTIEESTREIRAQDITNAPSEFTFSAVIPLSWGTETIQATKAINLYDPTAKGSDTLNKSQIFIRHFSANEFLTLQSVNVLERNETTVDGHQAVRYVIQKKSDMPEFTGQPFWRNTKHTVTDVRVSNTGRSVFYVIAKRPDLSDEVYNRFLDQFGVTGAKSQSGPIEPIAEFQKRITKKSFGTYVTPQNLPVSPEKFSGYHTGVDVEYDDVSSDVSVKAIVDGEVVVSRTAAGYGGVMVLRHTIDNKSILTVYGHLNPSSMKSGSVKKGDTIGILGQDGSTETDGERKHLHFAMLKGSTVDLKGYVTDKSELDNWYNPLDWYK